MTLLHLCHASMAFTDTDKDTREDYATALSRGADLVSFTETNPRNGNLDILRDVAKPLGWAILAPAGEGDTCIAARPGLPVLEHGGELVNHPMGRTPSHIGHGPRFAAWVRVEWEGSEVFYVAAHWVTGFGTSEARRAEHEAMSHEVVRLVNEYGKGARLAFFGGDVNMGQEEDRGKNPRGPHAIWTAGGLTTVWDELSVYPATHGRKRTIDVIGSYDRDARVTAEAARSWPRTNSDHRQISAWYDVTPGARPPHECPICGRLHRAAPTPKG